jgi:hypothetical protein
MRNWTEHGSSRLTAISDAGSTPAASTKLVNSFEDFGDQSRFSLKA